MNIEEYISSGILEAYLFNELSEKERREVEAMLEKYPELREELNAIELGLEDMAMATAVQPKSELKNNILGSILDEEVKPEIKPETSTAKSEARVVQMEPSPVWKYAVAASVTLALVSGYLAFDYRSKWKNSSDAYAQLLASNSQMAQQYNQVNQKLGSLEDDLAILSNPEFRRIEMAGTDNAKDAFASVYWNQVSQELYLDIRNLKQLAEDQQYQLWAIIDNQPVDMGVFDWDAEGLIRMKNTGKSVAFAVTIEPRGGSENPTLDSMQVIGNT